MKHLIILGGLLLFVLTVNTASAGLPEKDGKTIFTEQKCNKCHSVETANIAPTGTVKITDLSNVGSKHTVAFLKSYLLKQESINNKKHAPTWKGSDDELGILCGWMGTLKTKTN